MNKKVKTVKVVSQDIKIEDDCTVNLISTEGDCCKTITISTVNGYDQYAFLIGKQKGKTVRVDGAFWKIGYIEKKQKRKYHRRKYSLLSHPLNNSTHFVR